VAFVGVENSIECVFANVERGRVRQEVVANEEGQENKVVHETFEVKSTTRYTLFPQVGEFVSCRGLAPAGVRPHASLCVDM
jgi:hypothetical protein